MLQTAKKSRTTLNDTISQTIVVLDEEPEHQVIQRSNKDNVENSNLNTTQWINSDSKNQENVNNNVPAAVTTTVNSIGSSTHLKRKFDTMNDSSVPITVAPTHVETIDLTKDNFVDLTCEDAANTSTTYTHFHQVTFPEINNLRHTFFGFFPIINPPNGDKSFLHTATPITQHFHFDFETASYNESFLTCDDSDSDVDDAQSDEIEVLETLPIQLNDEGENRQLLLPQLSSPIIILESPKKEIESFPNIATTGPVANTTNIANITNATNITCSICLDKIKNITATVCGHIFCKKCIQNAIRKQKKCPMCRKSLTMNSIHPLFL